MEVSGLSCPKGLGVARWSYGNETRVQALPEPLLRQWRNGSILRLRGRAGSTIFLPGLVRDV